MSRLLVVNIGSTSLKYRLIEMDGEQTLARGYIERIGQPDSPFTCAAGGDTAADLFGTPAEQLKTVTCHLGGSSSLAAVKYGVSVDTSMGFTTQSGVPMAKRSADLDPFVIPYIMEKTGKSLDAALGEMVRNGGLAGISGLSGDMRDLLAEYGTNPRARLAVEHFVHEVKKYIGAYAAVMNGLDALVFSGGIGENADAVRAGVCRDMEVLGIALDNEKNARIRRQEAEISLPSSRVRVFVIPTNEEIVVARETARVMRGS